MNLDDSYIDPYATDWLALINKSNNEEQNRIAEGVDRYVPYSGISQPVMKAIFTICTKFQLDAHAKYLAVHIYDRYMFCYFRELVSCCGGELNDNTLPQIQRKMFVQAKLALLSCIQLASKMDMYKSGLMISDIFRILQVIDPSREYTKTSIFASEYKVLKTINFQIPLCTPIQVVEILLAIIKERNKPKRFDTCSQLLDISYLCHSEIFGKLHHYVTGEPLDKKNITDRTFLALKANVLFISAAVIVCSYFFYQETRIVLHRVSTILSDLIGIDTVSINIMADILFNNAMKESTFQELAQIKVNNDTIINESGDLVDDDDEDDDDEDDDNND